MFAGTSIDAFVSKRNANNCCLTRTRCMEAPTRARVESRDASCVVSGTQTAVRSPRSCRICSVLKESSMAFPDTLVTAVEMRPPPLCDTRLTGDAGQGLFALKSLENAWEFR